MAAPTPFPDRYADPVRIGVGGMGEVFRARDRELGRDVAVKVLAAPLALEEEHRRRFIREARAAARIASPNVVAIYDLGEHDGRPYIVMELVEGGSLAERARRGPVDHELALGWVEQAARALDAAHRNGVVHRDVKPSNLLLATDGSLKVADFGIARVLEGDGPTITRPGTMVGTVGYLSPEQVRGERGGPASDVYGLAVVAYELLTGGRPFGGRSCAAEAMAQLHETPPPPSERGVGLPAALDPVFARALATRPEDRHPDAGRFARELRGALTAREATPTAVLPAAGTPPPDAPPGGAPRIEVRGGSRPRPAVAAGVAALLAVVGGVVAIALMAGGGDAPGDPVEAARTAAATDAASEPAPAAPDPATTPSEATTPGAATTPDPATTGDPASAPAPDPGTAGERGRRGTPGHGRAPSFDQARRMTDRAWVEITRGRPEKAVALMERAVPVLARSGDLYEGYARYNLGRGLLDLGRCGEAVPHLEDALAQPGSAAQTAERDEMLGRARACAT